MFLRSQTKKQPQPFLAVQFRRNDYCSATQNSSKPSVSRNVGTGQLLLLMKKEMMEAWPAPVSY